MKLRNVGLVFAIVLTLAHASFAGCGHKKAARKVLKHGCVVALVPTQTFVLTAAPAYSPPVPTKSPQ